MEKYKFKERVVNLLNKLRIAEKSVLFGCEKIDLKLEKKNLKSKYEKDVVFLCSVQI